MQKIAKIINNEYVEFKKNKATTECDYLTGLQNRRALYDTYNKLSENAVVTLLFIDIDNFKRVNDVYGHSTGDELLKVVADFLRDTVTFGKIFRIGGDEFIIMMVGYYDEKVIKETTDSLIAGLHSIAFKRDVLSFITFSIGAVINQSTRLGLDTILSKSDAAMYQAKEHGKNQAVNYRTLEEEFKKTKLFEEEMEAALSHGEFVPYLLPKIDMITSKVYGAQVLCRWDHWLDGLRLPSEFIPLFEKNGFITTLDLYMFEEACKLKSNWVDTPLETMILSVNISEINLYFKDLADRLAAIAAQYDVQCNQIEIEVRETAFTKYTNDVKNTIENLVDHGFRVALDGFGETYAPIVLINDVPFTSVKISRNFFCDVLGDFKKEKLLKNLVVLCKDMKLSVVVEGIERKQESEWFMANGCYYAEGFLFSKPIPVEDFIKYALSNLGNVHKAVKFSFNHTMYSEDGRYLAQWVGDSQHSEIVYEEGPVPGSGSLYFPGGSHDENVVSIPKEIVRSESYTLCGWGKTKKSHFWTVISYIKYETGFGAFVPNCFEGSCCYRIRDSRNLVGWYDTVSFEMPENEWYHFAVTYNALSETAIIYLNGEMTNELKNVPVQRFPLLFQLGGDPFQQSFNGWLSDIVFWAEVKNPKEIKEIYDSYGVKSVTK